MEEALILHLAYLARKKPITAETIISEVELFAQAYGPSEQEIEHLVTRLTERFVLPDRQISSANALDNRYWLCYNQHISERRMEMIVAYAYEAALHCPSCSYKRFGEILEGAIDNEGNLVTPVFVWQTNDYVGECCDDCFEVFE